MNWFNTHPLRVSLTALLAAPLLGPLSGGCSSSQSGGPANDPAIQANLTAKCERAGGVSSHQRPYRVLEVCERGKQGECLMAEGITAIACDLPRSEGMCGDRVSAEELLLMLNGAVVAAGDQIEDGVSVYELLVGVVISMLYNGIDWNQLDDLSVDFDPSDGSYVLESGASRVGFRLSWARDFDTFTAGDPIDLNVFDLDSYVRGISVDVGGTVANPRVSYDFDEGPLFDLIEGSVDIEGRDPRSLKVKAKLHADALAIELFSVGRRRFDGDIPWTRGLVKTTFDYETHMASNPISIPDVVDQLEGGGFAIDLANTVFEREYWVFDEPIYRTRDVFETTDFAIKSDADGAFFEGTYQGAHEVEARVLDVVFTGALYHEGLLSNRQQNHTTFYCNAARDDLWGTALHDLDLKGGLFTFSSGLRARYGIGGLEWEEDQVED